MNELSVYDINNANERERDCAYPQSQRAFCEVRDRATSGTVGLGIGEVVIDSTGALFFADYAGAVYGVVGAAA